MLPAGMKIAPDEILQTTRCKCASIQCKTTVAVSEVDLTVQNSAIINNAIIKVTCTWTCTWMIMKLKNNEKFIRYDMIIFLF